MKIKSICTVISVLLLLTNVAYAGYSQSQIETVINNAFAWMENYAAPTGSPGSNSSDYYIMALSRMNKDYDFDSYTRITESINPATKQDGQRLIMANSACGQKLSSSFVSLFTYDAEFDTASDIASSLIALDSGGYSITHSDINKNIMISSLMSMQQSNGSFDNNVLSTAKAVIALSNYINTVYELQASSESGTYTYNTNSSISAALDYLSSNQTSDGGYGSIIDTAYTVIALDSIGVDADNDTRFQKDGNSGVGFLISMQYSDGSFLSSADDTSIATCALVSHLRAMQGKSKFFDFTARDTLDSTALDSESENHSGEGTVSPQTNNSGTSATAAPAATHNVIQLTPLPTTAPEHSAISAEEYGPFPFVGPKQNDENDELSYTESDSSNDNDDSALTGKAKGMLIITAVLLLMGASVFYLYKSQPEAFKALFKKDDSEPKSENDNNIKKSKEGIDTIDFDNYEFVESELVNSYLDNFDKLANKDQTSDLTPDNPKTDDNISDNNSV